MSKAATAVKERSPRFGERAEPEIAKPAKAAKPPAKRGQTKTTSTALAIPEAAPRNILEVIMRASVDPRCEPAKIRELYEIHRMMEADQAKAVFIQAFLALQDDLPTITANGLIHIPAKDGKREQNTPFMRFPDMMRVLKPLLKKHGFTLSFATEPSADGTKLIVRGLLDQVRGHSRDTQFPLPAETSGSKNNVQGWGSSMSYGKRYATIALLNIISEAPEDADDDGQAAGGKAAGKAATKRTGKTTAEQPEEQGEPAQTEPVISQQQHDTLVDAIEGCGTTRKAFCAHYSKVLDREITKVEELPARLYGDAIKACKDFADRKKPTGAEA